MKFHSLSRKGFSTSIVILLVTLWSNAQTYTSFGGLFGQPTQLISELTDVLYRATDRFSVSPNIPSLFNGQINENNWSIPSGSPATMTIDLTAKGEVPSSGVTYPDGYVFISFYSGSTPQSVTGRVKDASNTWRNILYWTNVSNSSSYAVWKGYMPSFNYMTVIELTITPQSGFPTLVSKIEYHRSRADQNLQSAFFSKYLDNKVYNNLMFADNNNVTNLKLSNNAASFFNNAVGVGTATPNTNAKLDVNGNIFTSGKLAIGTTDMTKIAPYALAVNGEAIFNKARVKLYNTWPDYVFHKNYKLPSLIELEEFIRINNHLPDIPSAAQVEEEGIDLGVNQALLLKKIEELTLYVIKQQKELEVLKGQMKQKVKKMK